MRQAAYWAILVLICCGCSESTTENPPLEDADVTNNMDVSDTTESTPDLIQNDEGSDELPPQEDTLECADGFAPQDSECVDVNECAATESPCDENASCSNSEGGFSCECNAGYDGDGTTCSPILLGALSISTVDVAIEGSCLALELIMTLNDTDDTESLWPVELALDGGGLFSDAECTEVASNPIEMAAKQEPGVVFVRFDESGTKSLTASHLTLEDDSTELIIHGSSYADDTRPQRTLVLYNKNADDALEIASYYAEKREIPENHLCGVRLPRGNFAFPQEMLGARKTIVEECFCTILGEKAPAECGVGSLTEILAVLNLTHIAVIRGIPARLYGTPWPQDSWDPGFDFNLSYSLANKEDIFADDTDGNLKIDFPFAGNQLCNNTFETIKPSEHRYFAISRIEAITATRTKALIDQTLAAEGQGFQGNIVSELPAGIAPSNNVGQYVTSTFNSECLSYLSHTPFKHGEAENSWPFEVCRFGTTGSTSDAPWPGMMPGFNPTTIPLAVNVGWFDGSDPRTQEGEPQNNHSAFYSYNTMLKWRKSGETCLTECDDFSDPAEESACRENSTDYFKEINSECVGVAPGFMGQQLRSYPVQYYGFLPPGWFGGPSGAYETTPAHIVQGGAFKNDTFSDDLFARFGAGSPGSVNNDLCVDDSGVEAGCPERVSVGIARKITLKSPIAVNADKMLTVRVRYRNQGAAGAKLQVRIWLNNENSDLKDTENKALYIPLQDSHDTWTLYEKTLAVSAADVSEITKVRLWFHGKVEHKAVGFVDLDGIELVDQDTGASLLGDDPHFSFAVTKPSANGKGASAATVIDRMNGIGYWGSSSHFLTGGFAWRSNQVTYMAFSGFTLGESLAYAGAKSGIAYVDPLYRSFGIRFEHDKFSKACAHLVNNVWEDDNGIKIHVLQGTQHLHTVQWNVSACFAETLADCADQWESLLTGVGAVRDYLLTPAWLAKTLGIDQLKWIRLRAHRADQPGNHLSTYARVRVHAKPYEALPACDWDWDKNGMLAGTELNLIMKYRLCSDAALLFDLDDNNCVNNQDVNLSSTLIGSSDPAYDLDGDGEFTLSDKILIKGLFCGELQKNSGKGGSNDEKALEDVAINLMFGMKITAANLDLNEDGVIDDSDLALFKAAEGLNDCPCTLDASKQHMCKSNL